MKTAMIIGAGILFCGSFHGYSQTSPSYKDLQNQLKPACESARKIVAAYNESHPREPKKTLECSFSWPSSSRPQVRKTIPLTLEESRQLDQIRNKTDRAFDVQEAFENYLIAKHGIKKYEIEDKCYRFVGIVTGTHVITYDLYPMIDEGVPCDEVNK